MTPDEMLARARSMLGKGTVYALGRGGMKPDAEFAYDAEKRCDCSGYIAWCLGTSRHTDNPWYKHVNGGWLETSAIFKDCATPFGIFDGVEWIAAQPSDLLVWGDHDGHQGHVGVVSQVDENGPTFAIHCSSGNYKGLGDAVAETSSLIFKHHDARVARCAWVEHQGVE